jgi:hypothetical protein
MSGDTVALNVTHNADTLSTVGLSYSVLNLTETDQIAETENSEWQQHPFDSKHVAMAINNNKVCTKKHSACCCMQSVRHLGHVDVRLP